MLGEGRRGRSGGCEWRYFGLGVFLCWVVKGLWFRLDGGRSWRLGKGGLEWDRVFVFVFSSNPFLHVAWRRNLPQPKFRGASLSLGLPAHHFIYPPSLKTRVQEYTDPESVLHRPEARVLRQTSTLPFPSIEPDCSLHDVSTWLVNVLNKNQ